MPTSKMWSKTIIMRHCKYRSALSSRGKQLQKQTFLITGGRGWTEATVGTANTILWHIWAVLWATDQHVPESADWLDCKSHEADYFGKNNTTEEIGPALLNFGLEPMA